MKVGGRDFYSRKIDVEQAMRGEKPEDIQKYAVEVNGMHFPPKQVLARVTGWERQSFTTMEAQRVLTKIGFVCGERKSVGNGRLLVVPPSQAGQTDADGRLAALEAAVATAQEAIAGLGARVRALEAAAG